MVTGPSEERNPATDMVSPPSGKRASESVLSTTTNSAMPQPYGEGWWFPRLATSIARQAASNVTGVADINTV